MQLRDYQIEAIKQLQKGFKKHKRQVLCLPTGAGKSLTFSEIAYRCYNKGTTVLVLTDRKELFAQNLATLMHNDVVVEEIRAGKSNVYESAHMYIAMVETLKRRKNLDIKPGLIIIDEAHKGNFTPIIEQYNDAYVIGVTATPVGKHFHKYYTNIVQNIDTPDLIEQGYLVDYKAYQMVSGMEELKVSRGEYTDASLMINFDKQKMYDGVVDGYLAKCQGRQTLVFNVNIEHTIKTHEAFVKAGIRSEYVTSKTPKEKRERVLEAFKMGLFPVLHNCGILTTGYDNPSISAVIMNRATKSLPLFLQCAGRASRLYEGKDNFVMLDYGENHKVHDMWNISRKWSLKPPSKKKDAVAPVKVCPNCEYMMHASIMICPECEHVFPKKGVGLVKGQLVEVTAKVPEHLVGKRIDDLSVKELSDLVDSKKYSANFAFRVLRSRGEEALEEWATMKGYKKGWVYRQMKDGKKQYNNYKLK